MGCCNEDYKDNREHCGEVLPSSCVPYTGYIHDDAKKEFKCKPNINDILKVLQDVTYKMKNSLGDNEKLILGCLAEELEEGFTQEELNQSLILNLCYIKESMNRGAIDPETIRIAINLLCLEDSSCEPKDKYSIVELFNKLIVAHCSLLTRVQNIENALNL